MHKQLLVFRMTNFADRVEIACTHNFIGKWQAEGFTMTGALYFDSTTSIMDISPTDIPLNVNPGGEE